MLQKKEEDGARILVVDDDAAVRRLIRDSVGDEDYRVFEANNGSEAMALLVHHKVDLMICDMTMPVQDGINTVLEVCHDYPRLKIIGISAAVEKLEKAKLFGVKHTLVKPFDPEKLAELVGNLVAN